MISSAIVCLFPGLHHSFDAPRVSHGMVYRNCEITGDTSGLFYGDFSSDRSRQQFSDIVRLDFRIRNASPKQRDTSRLRPGRL